MASQREGVLAREREQSLIETVQETREAAEWERTRYETSLKESYREEQKRWEEMRSTDWKNREEARRKDWMEAEETHMSDWIAVGEAQRGYESACEKYYQWEIEAMEQESAAMAKALETDQEKLELERQVFNAKVVAEEAQEMAEEAVQRETQAIKEAEKTTEKLRKAADELRTLKKEVRALWIDKSWVPEQKAAAFKRGREREKAEVAVESSFRLKKKGVISNESRGMIRDLVGLGISAGKVGGVVAVIAEHIGVPVKGKIRLCLRGIEMVQ
ncbi:hypothetical protein JAAARDRAFT_51565 [Jaapia argillacea MUCL 33604]|uniref:Uncharacterized protein n=1 Tax=Jaapia argillacea MUCL 33604 TaxID=933084 RepID=A0A067PH92_9AGAM|nr:hypothetical protein JAAARDRAFT_51565 [Jaapia argillacea MUCL 33604]